MHIYIFSIDNYIQVMKHRIYNFPLRAEEKQIHKVHRASTGRARPGAGAPGRAGGAAAALTSHMVADAGVGWCYGWTVMLADPRLPGRGGLGPV